jgi:hypothetical protein
MNPLRITKPTLYRSLRKAYSAERAAAFAYVGHAAALRDAEAREAIRRIEDDEWAHRAEVLKIMRRWDVPVSRREEIKYWWIGKIIGLSCHLIGRFMPYFFAGKLESGNVCEYFVMLRQFRELGIHEHEAALYEMGVREKEHEVYFQEVIKNEPWLPLFERLFNWGAETTLNDVDYADLRPVDEAHTYCEAYKKGAKP